MPLAKLLRRLGGRPPAPTSPVATPKRTALQPYVPAPVPPTVITPQDQPVIAAFAVFARHGSGTTWGQFIQHLKSRHAALDPELAKATKEIAELNQIPRYRP